MSGKVMQRLEIRIPIDTSVEAADYADTFWEILAGMIKDSFDAASDDWGPKIKMSVVRDADWQLDLVFRTWAVQKDEGE